MTYKGRFSYLSSLPVTEPHAASLRVVAPDTRQDIHLMPVDTARQEAARRQRAVHDTFAK